MFNDIHDQNKHCDFKMLKTYKKAKRVSNNVATYSKITECDRNSNAKLFTA